MNCHISNNVVDPNLGVPPAGRPELLKSVRSGADPAIVAQDRQSLLRERFENGTGTNMVFTWVLVASMVAMFWSVSPHTPLLIWAGVKSVSSLAVFAFRRQSRGLTNWYPFELSLQVAEGTAWGLIAMVAMPTDSVHQALLVAVLGCVVVASSAGESQFSGLYLGFLAPMAATVGFGFFVHPGGLKTAGFLYLLAVVFAVVAGSDDRRLHHRLADVTIENEALLTKLEDEHAALAAVNTKLDRLAWTDALTGLANRAAATRHMDEALSTSTPDRRALTVAFLDLDGFKQINDRCGHGTGDQILMCVAKRLQERASATELVCRLGGDELVVLSRTDDVDELGERLASAF